MRLALLAAKRGDNKYNLGYPGSREALQRLLTYRLPMNGPIKEIKQEWMEIIEGKHRLWRGIDPEKRECVRGFLVQFHSDILHRAHRNFNFRGGSIGNFFLAAMQRFFRSIQSAIFLFSALTDISSVLPGCHVVPAINTNKTTTIAAKLTDGKVLVGQCEISHPSLDSIKTPTEPAKPPQRSRRFSSELQDSVLGLGQSPRLHQLLLRSTLEPQGFRSESGLHDLDDSDFSDEVDDLFEDDAFDIPDVSEAMGNLMYGSKDQALPLSAPIERTWRTLTSGLFYVNVRFFTHFSRIVMKCFQRQMLPTLRDYSIAQHWYIHVGPCGQVSFPVSCCVVFLRRLLALPNLNTRCCCSTLSTTVSRTGS